MEALMPGTMKVLPARRPPSATIYSGAALSSAAAVWMPEVSTTNASAAAKARKQLTRYFLR
jgi:hypothetical protein